MHFRSRALAGIIVAAGLLLSGGAAAGPLVIKRPGVHPTYALEMEPHLLIGMLDPPGAAHGSGLGVGARATYTLVDNGFIPTINNSVGLGAGIDWISYSKGDNSCSRDNNPGGNCDAANDQDEGVTYLWIPIVMQWNFWLSRDWSVFGEPGISVLYDSNGRERSWKIDPFHLYVGGRWHFSDYMSLTLRLGFPTNSAGVSFLF